jgi:hypothetical protein
VLSPKFSQEVLPKQAITVYKLMNTGTVRIGKEWTAVKSTAGEGGKGEKAFAAQAKAVAKQDAKSPKGKSGKSLPAPSDKKPPVSPAAPAEKPPVAKALSILDDDDDDIDEDWGME